jgi:hypothetical protein
MADLGRLSKCPRPQINQFLGLARGTVINRNFMASSYQVRRHARTHMP